VFSSLHTSVGLAFVGAGTSRLRGAVPLKSTSVPSKNVTKVSKSSSSQVAREPRGGTPSKKKR
jgi:hypothetical protein